ncbi:MAG: carboxypeptidase regulatory-like domain-containing protein [Acidobacteria bacterium]|nr:carboxypeptidase regulatory-like domain-containing protein [Acidobacteriota bacterium]
MRSNLLLRTLCAALLVAASAVAASAQSTQVNGTVTLKQADGTTVPVAGAQIDIYRTDIKSEFHTKTDKKGKYIHAGLPFVGTYTIVVSAPGAAPTFLSKQRFTQDTARDFELRPGDGSRPTLEDTTKSAAAGGGGGGGTGGGAPAPHSESKEEKAAREAREKEIAEIEKKNAEITKSNEVVSRVFKAGNDALFANPPRLEEAISNYREGLAARPEEVALLTNLAEALRQRADSRYNASVKETSADAKLAAQNDAKKDWAESAELASKAVTLVKAAAPSGPNVNATAYEQNKKAAYSVRALALRRVVAKVDSTKAADAVAASQEYMEIEPDPAKKAKIRSETLQALFDGGAIEQATAEAQKVLAEDPDNPDANRVLGLALFSTGDKAKFQEAANYLQRYVDKAPDTDPLKQSAKESLDYLKTAENVKPEKTTPARPSRRRP